MKKNLVLKQSVIAVALAIAATQSASAQEAAVVSQTVYVTGSNLKRTDKEGPQPIQVINAKDIRESGASTVTELMRLVPSMGTDQNLDTNDGSFSRGVSTASLRGLSSSSTLVLLNGRRMTPSAYADPNNGNSVLYDLNSIPVTALERVEVLKGGASAIYGSDAIGGVINFITKSNYQGAEVSARASANDDGKFARKGANIFAGTGDYETNGYNVFIAADISERDRVLREDVKDVEFDEMKTIASRYRTPYGSTISAYPVFYRESAPGTNNFGVTRANMADRLVVRTNCDPSRQLVGSTDMGLSAASVFVGRTFCNFDTNQYLEGMGAGRDANVLTRATFKLGQDTKAFAEAGYGRTERKYTAAPISISTGVVTNFMSTGTTTPYQTILPIGHPDNPFPTARSSVAYRFENAPSGTQTINSNIRLLAGLQGTFGSWDWESGVLYNQANKDDTYFGRLHLPTLRKINAGSTIASVAADPALFRTTTSDDMASILQWDIRANTTFGKLSGGEVGLAVGAEARREKLVLRPDEQLSSGQIYGLANTIIDGERDVMSAFAEVHLPVLKNLSIDLAGRFDKYPGIDANFVPQVGAKWNVTNSLALRGAFGKGFRAPALSQVTPGGAQYFLSGIVDPRRCNTTTNLPLPGATATDCAKSTAGVGQANPGLVPEKSKTYSLGILFSPTSTMDFGLDFYKIRKVGEVALVSSFETLRSEDANPQNVVRDTNPENFVRDANGNPVPNTGPLLMVRTPWANQGAVETSGVDIDFAFRKNLGAWGNLSTKLSSTYVHKYTIAQHAGDVEHNLAGYSAGLVDWNLSSGMDLPKWKTTVSASLTRGAHSVSANVNYIGSLSLMRKWDGDTTYATPTCHYGTAAVPGVASVNATQPLYTTYYPDCKVKPWVRLGMGYTYTGIKGLSLTFNVQNLLDEKAPLDPRYTASGGAPLVGYNEGLHNPYGRYYSMTAKYAF